MFLNIAKIFMLLTSSEGLHTSLCHLLPFSPIFIVTISHTYTLFLGIYASDFANDLNDNFNILSPCVDVRMLFVEISLYVKLPLHTTAELPYSLVIYAFVSQYNNARY